MSEPRVGIVGARRERQGLGPYVARDLEASGARVPCFYGTRPATVAEAKRALAEQGVTARGYTDLGRMLELESLDALAILSPAESHDAALEPALDAGLHVLCEKPLLWGGGGLADRTAERVASFADRGLLLRENCQWPFTLAAFERLHPDAFAEPLQHFAMELEPASTGIQLLGDSLSHPLSLLQALAPASEAAVEALRFPPEPDPQRVRLQFRYCAGAVRAEVDIDLRAGTRTPRRAAYAVNGHRAERRIRPENYTMQLASGERTVELDDPLTARIGAFVAELREVLTGRRSVEPAREIAERMALFEQIIDAYTKRANA